jgi:hypothetical protein
MNEDVASDLPPGCESYRTCPECGVDCTPEPFLTKNVIHIAFACPNHGVHTVIDPLAGSR